jgi:hypothetical protein
LSLSSQSSRSCAGLKIKVLKDKGLEFANSIRWFNETHLDYGSEVVIGKKQTSWIISLHLSVDR